PPGDNDQSMKEDEPSSKIVGFCIIRAFKTLFQRMIKSSLPLLPSDFIKNLHELLPNYKVNTKQDSSELLQGIFKCFDRSGTRKIREIFGFGTRTTVTCTVCKKVSSHVENHTVLQLALGETLGNLRNLLAKFCQIEWLRGTNAYECDQCGKLQHSEMQTNLETFPEILVILFKRFRVDNQNTTHKLNSPIHFDEILDLDKPYANDEFKVENDWTYSLYGILCHEGSDLSSGHYITYFKDQDDFWYKADDSIITKCNLKLDLNLQESVYMLFYKKSAPIIAVSPSISSEQSDMPFVWNGNEIEITSSPMIVTKDCQEQKAQAEFHVNVRLTQKRQGKSDIFGSQKPKKKARNARQLYIQTASSSSSKSDKHPVLKIDIPSISHYLNWIINWYIVCIDDSTGMVYMHPAKRILRNLKDRNAPLICVVNENGLPDLRHQPLKKLLNLNTHELFLYGTYPTHKVVASNTKPRKRNCNGEIIPINEYTATSQSQNESDSTQNQIQSAKGFE
ncbi:unnamed protein product, partial [Didymodactylos carnosus]